MPETTNAPTTTVLPKTERPKLHKVILLNDDYTPREFVVRVLKGEFGMNEGSASRDNAEASTDNAAEAA